VVPELCKPLQQILFPVLECGYRRNQVKFKDIDGITYTGAGLVVLLVGDVANHLL
jgi:hypothetical protein